MSSYREEINRMIREASIRNEGRVQTFIQLTDKDGCVVDYLGRRSDECDGFGDDGHGIILVNAGAKLLEREATTEGYADYYSYNWTDVDVEKLASAIWEECSVSPMELDDDADVDEIRYFEEKLRLDEEFESDLNPKYGGPDLEDPRTEGYEIITRDADVVVNRLTGASCGCGSDAVNLKIKLIKKSGFNSRTSFYDYPSPRWDSSRDWKEYEEIELTTRYNDDDNLEENEKKARAFLDGAEWYALETVEMLDDEED